MAGADAARERAPGGERGERGLAHGGELARVGHHELVLGVRRAAERGVAAHQVQQLGRVDDGLRAGRSRSTSRRPPSAGRPTARPRSRAARPARGAGRSRRPRRRRRAGARRASSGRSRRDRPGPAAPAWVMPSISIPMRATPESRTSASSASTWPASSRGRTSDTRRPRCSAGGRPLIAASEWETSSKRSCSSCTANPIGASACRPSTRPDAASACSSGLTPTRRL